MKKLLIYLELAVVLSICFAIAGAVNVTYIHPRPVTGLEIALVAILDVTTVICLIISERAKEGTK